MTMGSRAHSVIEWLMRWHDPAADQRRYQKAEEARQRAIASRKRAEAVVASYRQESQDAKRRVRG